MDPAETAATSAALNRLAARDYSPAELKAKLIKNHDEVLVDRVLVKLELAGWISESRAVNSLLTRLSGRRAAGDEVLRQKLLALGCTQETASEILASQVETEFDRARKLVEHKFKQPTDPAKIGRFLFSRGFEESTIDSVLENLSWPDSE